jgi:cytochrome c553
VLIVVVAALVILLLRPAVAHAARAGLAESTSPLERAQAAGRLVGIQATPQLVVTGQRAASGGTRAGAGAACFNCHGMQGEGDATGGFPRLAGLSAFYIAKQLDNYADGTRPHEQMTPIALQMTDAERRAVGIYYATLAPSLRRLPAVDPALVQTGAGIAAQGVGPRGVQACSNCHGLHGAGMPPDVPPLAGQNTRYLELQLQRWQQGIRRNDVAGVMADIARRLSAEEQRAVAAYFGSLPPP